MARRLLFPWRHALASEEGPAAASERLVALALSLYMNGDGLGAWPSQEVLALRTGLTARTVRDALERLVAKGWLAREPRKSPRGVKSKRFGYEYRACLPVRLSNMLANGEANSLFSGKEPRRVPHKKNGEINDKRIGKQFPTNTSYEYFKPDAYKKKQYQKAKLERAEIASYQAAFADSSAMR